MESTKRLRSFTRMLPGLLAGSLFLSGCSKALTESSASAVIQKWVDAQAGGIASSNASSLTSQIGAEMPQRWTMAGVQRALKEGYLQEKTLTVTFPNFSGQFTGRRGFAGGSPYGGWNDTLNLATNAGHPPFASGFFRTCYSYDPNGFFRPNDNCWGGTFNGPIQRNGSGPSRFTIRVTQFSPYVGMLPNTTFTFSASLARGSPDVIHGALETDPVQMQGRANGADIQQDVYVYLWTDKLPKNIFNGSVLRLGHIVVERCEHLLLVSETTATAACQTHVKLTSAAEVIFGNRPTDQTMQASFGKQPDGSWVGTGINYLPPQYNIFQ